MSSEPPDPLPPPSDSFWSTFDLPAFLAKQETAALASLAVRLILEVFPEGIPVEVPPKEHRDNVLELVSALLATRAETEGEDEVRKCLDQSYFAITGRVIDDPEYEAMRGRLREKVARKEAAESRTIH